MSKLRCVYWVCCHAFETQLCAVPLRDPGSGCKLQHIQGLFWCVFVRRAMTLFHLCTGARSLLKSYRHRAVLKTVQGLRVWEFKNMYTSIALHNSLEEILRKTVAPLPTYEMRDKSPPPPESSSLEFMHFFKSLEKEQKLEFFEKLSHDFGVDHRWASDLAVKLLNTQGRDVATILQVEDRLRYSLTPRYRQLLTHISKVQGGVKFLVDLRADLIEFASSKMSDSPHMRVNIYIHLSLQ